MISNLDQTTGFSLISSQPLNWMICLVILGNTDTSKPNNEKHSISYNYEYEHQFKDRYADDCGQILKFSVLPLISFG